MVIQPLKSNKLYYNKWPYRVECYQPGSSRIIRSGKKTVDQWCKGFDSNISRYWDQMYDFNRTVSFEKRTEVLKANLLAFSDAVGPYLDFPGVQIRTEGSKFNLFCKDTEILENISRDLENWITRINGPVNQEEYDYLMQTGRRRVICDQLPKNGLFRYRVYLKPKWSAEERVKFYNWAKSSNNFHIPQGAESWLLGMPPANKWSHPNPFIYVKDEKSLTMVNLFAGSNIRKIEEFVLRNTITVG